MKAGIARLPDQSKLARPAGRTGAVERVRPAAGAVARGLLSERLLAVFSRH
jgi:hypothetical protein